jgi:hypothetical protein
LQLYCRPSDWFDDAVSMEPFPQRLNGKLYRLFVTLLIVYAALTSFGPMMNQVDLGWQVAQGRWIVQHFAPYSHDLFNYPNLNRPVINEYPLFEIVLYTAWSLGWWGPCLLTAFAYVTLLVVLFRGAQKIGMSESPLVAIAAGLMLLFFQVAFPLRPHVATYLGVVVTGLFLLTHRNAKNWTSFWPLALLQIAWTNCHSGFVLGPAMVGLFGVEATIRHLLRDKMVPWLELRTWLGATALIFLACFINPDGAARFYPPFFQDRLESIRAYVGEMEPLVGGLATIYGELTLIAVVVVAVAVIRHRAISFSFLALAILLYVQAQSVNKAWPVFGLFIPLLVLSSAALATNSHKAESWSGAFALFVATVAAAMAVIGRFNPTWDSSLQHQWREYDHGRTEIATEAVAWMKAHNIKGRLFHRCEEGGWLQMSGYAHGETFSDTGFGKYDEAFIHEVGLVNERPALLPKFLAKYQPDFVVCGNFCFQWPYYLRAGSYHLIFYSPNSSVWAQNDIRPDLPSVTDQQIMDAFDHDLAVNGLPNASLLGRNIIALHSMGLEDFAYAKLTGLPPEYQNQPWFWEAARFLCFTDPPGSPEHRSALLHLSAAPVITPAMEEFQAYADNAAGDVEAARRIVHAIPTDQFSNTSAELLLKIRLDRNLPEALDLARRTDCFDLRNGRHWQYLAEAEERWGSLDAALIAWRKAVFYYPDDEALMQAAREFATKHKDAELKQAISDSP